MKETVKLVANKQKAWTAGLAAAIGGYILDLISAAMTTPIPAEVEAGVIGLLVALMAWAVPNGEVK